MLVVVLVELMNVIVKCILHIFVHFLHVLKLPHLLVQLVDLAVNVLYCISILENLSLKPACKVVCVRFKSVASASFLFVLF